MAEGRSATPPATPSSRLRRTQGPTLPAAVRPLGTTAARRALAATPSIRGSGLALAKPAPPGARCVPDPGFVVSSTDAGGSGTAADLDAPSRRRPGRLPGWRAAAMHTLNGTPGSPVSFPGPSSPMCPAASAWTSQGRLQHLLPSWNGASERKRNQAAQAVLQASPPCTRFLLDRVLLAPAHGRDGCPGGPGPSRLHDQCRRRGALHE